MAEQWIKYYYVGGNAKARFTMKLNEKEFKEIVKRVDKLNNLEIALINFDDSVMSITRLTVIKYLCRDCLAMLEFAYFISNKVKSRIKYAENNISLETPINESLQLMKKIIIDFVDKLNIDSITLSKLDVLRKEIKDYQNIIEKKKWSDIRIIKNWDILIIEEAISCFIHFDYPEMGYQLAKSYTEKYNARFGTGLLPESLEYLKDINNYWKDYLYKLKSTTANNL